MTTLAGYLLVVVISKGGLFDTPLMGSGTTSLPADVNCEAAARLMVDKKIASEAYCIPLYKK